jgi:hypothetical protein
MRRFNTMMACACAAALTTLVVIVTVPAIADDPAAAKGDGADAFAACLRDHGLPGAPDDPALKPWLGERLDRGDAVAERALKKCSTQSRDAGPSVQALRSCLADHGLAVPGGGAAALKRWLLEHGDDAAYRAGLKACGMAPVKKPDAAGPCGDPGGVPKALPPARAGKTV